MERAHFISEIIKLFSNISKVKYPKVILTWCLTQIIWVRLIFNFFLVLACLILLLIIIFFVLYIITKPNSLLAGVCRNTLLCLCLLKLLLSLRLFRLWLISCRNYLYLEISLHFCLFIFYHHRVSANVFFKLLLWYRFN